jgi:CheY-like chemotaxis protein
MTTAKKHKILVVDDEYALRSIMSAELEAEGYDVTTAGDGDEAISILVSFHFDLVLLDNQMQRVDGYEVLKFVRERHPDTKVIMVTGSKETPIPDDAMIRKAEEVIVKPFELTTLLDSLKHFLDTPSQAS